MTVADTLSNTTRAAHDVGLAAWLGGSMFGKFAHNPSLTRISSHAERGKVANAAWNGYNPINAVGLGVAALGWTAARLTDDRPDALPANEQALATAKDVLMGLAVVGGIANGIQGARLAKQGPDGAVPIESGTEPATETPQEAARIQRSLGVLGNLNIATGVALVAVNAVIAQVNHDHPSPKRLVATASRPSPLWLLSALGTAAAALDEVRTRTDG